MNIDFTFGVYNRRDVLNVRYFEPIIGRSYIAVQESQFWISYSAKNNC